MNVGSPKANSPASAAATVSAEKVMVRPAAPRWYSTASVDDRAARGAFLAEPVDHQQAVVDRQREAEQDDDIDGVAGDIGQVGHAEQQQHGTSDGGQRARQWEQRHADAAEDEEQRDQQDRQRDQLTAEEVARGRTIPSRLTARSPPTCTFAPGTLLFSVLRIFSTCRCRRPYRCSSSYRDQHQAAPAIG